MYKLIIVDDEPLALSCIANSLVWNDVGFELVGTFRNANKAIDYIDNHEVNAVITDIKMPKISGIEFTKLLCNRHPDIFVVLLSGHKDFDYAREAIRYNVFDYLLKPISQEALKKTCYKLCKAINESKAKSMYKDDFEILKCQQAMLNYLNGSDNNLKELQLFFLEANINIDIENSPIAMLNIELIGFMEYLKNVWKYGKDRLYNALNNFMQFDNIFLFPLSYAFDHIVMLAISKNINMPEFMQEIKDLCKKFSNDCLDNIDLPVNINIEEISKNITTLRNHNLELSKSTVQLNKDSNMVSNSILKAKTYINEHLNEDITLTKVCDHVAFSSYHFSRCFKKETGENFIDYLNRTKIEKAKELLLSNNYKIYEVYEKVGYKSRNHFYKLFKIYTGFTPQKYKDSVIKD